MSKSLVNYFSDKELCCSCCGLNNFSPELLTVLNCIRVLLGRPVVLNSACRCKNHNREVGGSKGSSHLKGLAADIRVNGSRERFDLLLAIFQFTGLPVTRVGIAKSFIHIDIDPDKDDEIVWVY